MKTSLQIRFREVNFSIPSYHYNHESAVPIQEEIIELRPDMIVHSRLPAAEMFARTALVFVLGSISVLFGAVQVWIWAMYTVILYAVFVGELWSHKQFKPVAQGIGLTRPTVWLVALFFGMNLLACVPLPADWISLLSPVRFMILEQASSITGLFPTWTYLSYTPFKSFAWWLFQLGLVLMFFALNAQFQSQRFRRFVLWVLFGVAVLQSFYGILQALMPNMSVLWATYVKAYMGDARGTYINRNHFAGFMEMMLPLMMGFLFSRVDWKGQVSGQNLLGSERLHQHMLMVLGLVVMMLALLFSRSRGGILGTLLGMFLFFAFIRGGTRKIPIGIWAACALFFGLTLLYGIKIGFEPILDRFLELEGGNSRLDFWRDSLAIIADHPMGIGLAAFKTVFPVYDVSTALDDRMVYYLHNDVLQLLVETGWVGFGTLFFAFSVFMGVNFRRIRRMDSSADPGRFFLAAGAYSGLAAMTFHSFIDFNLQIPANAVYFVMLLALVRVLAHGKYRKPNRPRLRS